jgi:hypothetical protein
VGHCQLVHPRWNANTEMDLAEIGFEGVGWFNWPIIAASTRLL